MRAYESLDHTADAGLRIFGRDLPELFKHAALGMLDQMTDAAALRAEFQTAKQTAIPEEILHVDAIALEELFLSWLRELLFRFSAARFAAVDFHFLELDEKHLQVRVRGLRFDPARHDQKCDVKAVTYHDFKLRHHPDFWSAEVIFDV
jgi:SHS2 domain-containing protein